MLTAAVAVVASLLMTVAVPVAAQNRPTFRASANMVPISVTVRDDRGRLVTDLARDDFEVLSDGAPKAILQFQSEPSPITVALLMDRSGSMRVSYRAEAANEAARLLVSAMSPATDRLGLFAFDTSLTQATAFTAVSPDSLKALESLAPFGATSLYDALDYASHALVSDGAPRRAVVAMTDGMDTSSLLTASELAQRAAGIDVPVYVVMMAMGADAEAAREKPAQPGTGRSTSLQQLTESTGGSLFFSSAPSHSSQAARTIVTELHQQYLLAFTADSRPGWHRLTVRTRHHHHTVRARAGYVTR